MRPLAAFLQGRSRVEANPSPRSRVSVRPTPSQLLPPVRDFLRAPPELVDSLPRLLRFQHVLDAVCGAGGCREALTALVFDVIAVTGADDPNLGAVRRWVDSVRASDPSWGQLVQAGWPAQHRLLTGALMALFCDPCQIGERYLVDLATALVNAGQDQREILGRFEGHLLTAPDPFVREEVRAGLIAQAEELALFLAEDDEGVVPEQFSVSSARLAAWADCLIRSMEATAGRSIEGLYFETVLNPRCREKDGSIPTPKTFGLMLSYEAHGAGPRWQDERPALSFDVPPLSFERGTTQREWKKLSWDGAAWT